MLHTASLDQILTIWSQLDDARNGIGDSENNRTTVRLFQLTPYDPTIHRHAVAQPGSWSAIQEEQSRVTAKYALLDLLELYATKRGVRIRVRTNDMSMGATWMSTNSMRKNGTKTVAYVIWVR